MVEAEQEIHSTRDVVRRGGRQRVKDDRRLLPLELVDRAHPCTFREPGTKRGDLCVVRRDDQDVLQRQLSRLTFRVSPVGTVSCMSPEQIAGDDADQQSDVWSLGAVLYEMLAGQAAFKGEHQWTVMNAIANRTPTPLHSMRAQIPSAVEQIVMKALQKPRERRYGSADEFLAAEGYDPDCPCFVCVQRTA